MLPEGIWEESAFKCKKTCFSWHCNVQLTLITAKPTQVVIDQSITFWAESDRTWCVLILLWACVSMQLQTTSSLFKYEAMAWWFTTAHFKFSFTSLILNFIIISFDKTLWEAQVSKELLRDCCCSIFSIVLCFYVFLIHDIQHRFIYWLKTILMYITFIQTLLFLI